MAYRQLFEPIAPIEEKPQLQRRATVETSVQDTIQQVGLPGFGFEEDIDPTAPLSTIKGGEPVTFKPPMGVLAAEVGIKKAIRTGTKVPAQIAGIMAEGKIDAIANKFAPLQQARKLLFPEAEPWTPVQKITNALLDKDPEAKAFVEQVRTSLPPEEGSILAEYEADINKVLGLTPGKERILDVWGQIDPTDAKTAGEFFLDIGRLVGSQSEMLAHVAVPGGLGFTGIFSMIREGHAQGMKQEFEKRGFEFDPNEHSDVLDLSSSIQAVLETIIGRTVTLGGAMGKSALLKYVPGVNRLTPGAGAIATRATVGQALNVIIEGEEERAQTITEDTFTNLALQDYANKTGQEVKLIPWAETARKADYAAKIGRFTATGIQTTGIGPSVYRTYQETQTAKFKARLGEMIAGMSLEEQVRVMDTYEQMTNDFNGAALEATDKELTTRLQTMDIVDFTALAQDLGIPPGTDRDTAVAMMLRHKERLPGYFEVANQHLTNLLEQSDLSAFEKNMIKWGANGDITVEEILGVKSIFELTAQDAGFDNVDDFFEKMVSLRGTDSFIDLRQAFGMHGGRGEGGSDLPISNFDLSYSGSGEGVAAFGFGVYVTQKEGIAKSYAQAVHDRMPTITGAKAKELLAGADFDAIRTAMSEIGGVLLTDDQIQFAIDYVTQGEGKRKVDQLLRALVINLAGDKAFGSAIPQITERVADSLGVKRDTGFLYKLTLFPDQDPSTYTLLSWYERVPPEILKLLGKTPKTPQNIFSYIKTWGREVNIPIAELRRLSAVIKSHENFNEMEVADIYNETVARLEKELPGQAIHMTTDKGWRDTERLIAELQRVEGPQTGQQLYQELATELGSQKAASMFLLSKGVDGIVYPAESIAKGVRELEEGNKNFVIFDESKIRIEGAKQYDEEVTFFQTGSVFDEGGWISMETGKQIPSVTRAVRHAMEGRGFRRWWRSDAEFSDSKGNPIIMYHGTGRDIESFNNPAMRHVAGHFSPSPQLAGDFAKLSAQKGGNLLDMSIGNSLAQTGEARHWYTGETLMPVIINSNKIFDPKKPEHMHRLRKEILEDRLYSDAQRATLLDVLVGIQNTEFYNYYEHSEIQEALVALGYDGYFEREQHDLGGDQAANQVRNVAIFYGEQVKSVFNGGEFSPVEEHILMQTGRKTENGQVIRGQTTALAEGQFVIDLFKTGDVVTLAHEFAHVFSGYMNDAMVDTIIDMTIKQHYSKMDKKSQASFKEKMWHAWRIWKKNPTDPRLAKGELRTFLTQAQEMLATSFEVYLAKDQAPTPEFDNIFRQTKKAYLHYYKTVRKDKAVKLKIDTKLATQFDKMIAGEQALVRPMKRQVQLKDDDGNMVEYTLYESRSKNEKHRNTIAYLERAGANIDGLHSQLRGYVQVMLDRVSLDYHNMIGMVRNVAQAKKVMKRVDKELVAMETSVRGQRVKSIRKLAKSLRSKQVDKDLTALADSILDDLSVTPRTKKRLEKVDELVRLLRVSLIDNNEMPSELYNITKKDLNLIKEMQKKNITDLSTVELGILEAALSDLDIYIRATAEQHVKNRTAMYNSRTQNADDELKRDWRGRGTKGDKRARRDSFLKRARRFFKKSEAHQLVNLEMLADAGLGNKSEFHKIVQALIDGRKRQLSLIKQTEAVTRRINEDVDMNKVSNVVGTVRKKDMIEVELEVVDQDEDTKVITNEAGVKVAVKGPKKKKRTVKKLFTKAELMMFYGYTLNEDAYRHLLGGMVFKDEPDSLYRLNQEQIMTMLDQLDYQYKQVVRETMLMYDQIIAPLINEVSMELIGRKIAQEQNYLPLFISYFGRQNLEVLNMAQLDVNIKNFTKQLIEHMGFLNTRVGGSNPIHVTDFYAGTARNLKQVALYVGMAAPIRDAKTILFSDKGPGKDSVYNNLGRVLGNEQRKQLEEWIESLESPPIEKNDAMKLFTRLARLTQLGVLKLSARISIMQVPSFFVGARLGDVPHKFVAQVIGKGIADPSGLGVTMKYSMADMSKLSAVAYDRFEQTFVTGLRGGGDSFQASKQWTSPDARFAQAMHMKTFQGLVELARMGSKLETMPMKMMDAWAISKLLESVELWGAEQGWSQAQIINKWEELINTTQPTSDRLYQSNFLATGTPAKRVIFGLFQSQLDAYRGWRQRTIMHYNNVMYSDKYNVRPKSKKLKDIREAKKATKALKKGEMLKATENMMYLYVVSSSMIASIQTIFSRMGRDEEDESLIEQNALVDMIARMITNNMGAFSPITGNIKASVLNSIMRGWEPESFSWISADVALKALNTYGDSWQAAQDGDLGEAALLFNKAHIQMAQVVGLGWANVIRDAEKFYKEITK